MLKTIKLIDVIDQSLLSVMNESDYCLVDSNDKLFINLEKKSVQDALYFYIKSILKDKMVFGNNNVLLDSCKPNNNWRKKEKMRC